MSATIATSPMPAGLSFNVLPLGANKRPRVPWKFWETERQTVDDLEDLRLHDAATKGVCAVCGPVSGAGAGCLVCIDGRQGTRSRSAG